MSIDRKTGEETLASTAPPSWWNMAATPAFRCGIRLLSARLQNPLMWIFVVLLVSAQWAPAQAHSPFNRIVTQQPTQQLSSQTPSTSGAGANRKRGVAKHQVELAGRRVKGGGIDLYSLEKERELGRRLAQDVEARSQLISDPKIDEYVSRLGQRIALHSDAQLPFTIKVIESHDINAFGLPGGYLYVDSGLILAVDNEAELAGVVAHEVAHVAARHDTRIATRKRIWTVISYCSGPAGGLLKLAGYMFSMKSRRDAEREADFLGLEYQYASGYDPREFVQFFEMLDMAEDQNFIAKMFASYPLTEDRIRRAEKEISALPARDEHVVDTSEFQEVKSRLANIMLGQRKSEDGTPALRRYGSQDGNSSDKNGPIVR